MMNYQYTDGLVSARLATRFIRKTDWPIWANFFRDKLAGKFLPNYDETEPDKIAQKWVDFQLVRYAEQKFGMQWLLEKSTGNEIGQCGLLYQEVDGKYELEVGYAVMKSSWGMGYATEAAQLFRDYGFRTFEVDSIISLIDPKNTASQKVAEKNGMEMGPIVEFKGHQLNVWRIVRETWSDLANY